MDGGSPILVDVEALTGRVAGSVRARTVRVADLFCGAGGTSTGAVQALAARGLAVELVAVNHWPVAVDTHSRNHRTARHHCQDLATLRPIVAVPGGHLDLLIASPTCTHHSRARGGRPTNDQQRMDPWHVVTWLTELRVDRLFLENVPEFTQWGPVDPETGRPVKERQGEFFRAWLRTLEAIGFRLDWKIVVCADFGDATTRQRFLLMGRSDGRALRRPAPTHGRPGTPGVAPWRPARAIIDWRRKGRDALGRATPLKPNTLRRIMVGVARHFGALAPAYLAALEVELGRSVARWGDTTKAQAGRTRWQRLQADGAALVELRGTAASHPVDRPVPGITGGGTHLGLVAAELQPFTLGQHSGSAARGVDQPLMTVAGAGAIAVAEPALVHLKGRSDAASVDRPVPTIATHAQIGVAEGFVFPVNQGDGRARGVSPLGRPLPTVLTRESLGVAEPVLVHVNHADGTPRPADLDQPLPTVTHRRGLGVAQPLIAPYYGSGSGETCQPVDEPLDTITAKARFGLVEPAAEPFLTVYNTQPDGRDRAPHGIAAPVPAITTAPRLSLCEPAVEQAAADAADLRALAAARRLVVIDGRLCVLKLPFRMLGNDELAAATSFPEDYAFAGSPVEVTRQIGNAVPVRTAAAHIGALFDDE